MPLDVEQMEQVKRFFMTNMVVPDCPYCSGRGWKAGEIVAAPVVDERAPRGHERGDGSDRLRQLRARNVF